MKLSVAKQSKTHHKTISFENSTCRDTSVAMQSVMCEWSPSMADFLQVQKRLGTRLVCVCVCVYVHVRAHQFDAHHH